MNIRRYPGTKPFERNEHELFFGRTADIEKMLELMRFEPLVLLYSKSGLGKSSLINAGIIPELEFDKTTNNQIFTLRFTKYAQNVTKPIDNIVGRIKSTDTRRNLLDKVLPNQNSLWYHLKKRQLENEAETHFYLFFDQFEEIFSYPSEQILDFKQQLKELLYVKVPQNVRDELDLMLEIDHDFLQPHEIEKIYKPLTVKVIMAIRSDRMSLLNQISDYLPNILKVFYELTPLDRKKAEFAITEPASIANNSNFEFISPVFSFDENLLKRILDYLTENNTKTIETFQLQMICQRAENLVIEKHKQFKLPKYRIENTDLGELKSIFAAHYHESLQFFSNAEQQNRIRRVIEEKLIIENSRMSLPDKALLREEGIDEGVLRQLLETRILRSEPNTTGGISYEISHDTLVAPILEAKKVREEAEEEARAEAERQEELRLAREKAEKARIEKDKQRKIMLIMSSIAFFALIALIVSVVFYFDAQKATEKAEKNLKKFEIAEKQRLKTEANSLFQKAKNLQTFGETELAIDYLKQAIEKDSTNQEAQKMLEQIENQPERLH